MKGEHRSSHGGQHAPQLDVAPIVQRRLPAAHARLPQLSWQTGGGLPLQHQRACCKEPHSGFRHRGSGGESVKLGNMALRTGECVDECPIIRHEQESTRLFIQTPHGGGLFAPLHPLGWQQIVDELPRFPVAARTAQRLIERYVETIDKRDGLTIHQHLVRLHLGRCRTHYFSPEAHTPPFHPQRRFPAGTVAILTQKGIGSHHARIVP